MKSYEKNASMTNPIKVDACIENANNGGYPKISEPFHVLLANLVKASQMTATQNVTSVTSETLLKFKACMASFIERLIKCNLEDFELDKTASFDMATHIGLKNNQFANLMIGIYEVKYKNH
jgi:Fanconi anemia group I protein